MHCLLWIFGGLTSLKSLGLRKLLNLSSFVILVLSGPSLLVLNRPYWALLGTCTLTNIVHDSLQGCRAPRPEARPMAVKFGSRAGHTHRKIQRKCGVQITKYRHPCPQGRYTKSLNPKLWVQQPHNFGYSNPVDRGADIAIKHFAATRSLQPTAAHYCHSYISRY